MFIKEIFLRTKNDSIELPCRTVQDVVDAIHQLSGMKNTDLELHGEHRGMHVCGPVDSRYFVWLGIDGEGGRILTDPSKPKKGKVLKIYWAGSVGNTPENKTADLETTIAAVKAFATTGKPAKSLKWLH